FGRSGAHDGVKLVDEQDDVLGAPDFVHHGLDAFLELAAIFRPGNHQGQVQRDHALVPQQFRHVALGNLLRQPFDDGGLAHARFAKQHRVVLGAPAKDLNNPLDLVAAPDDRVQVALARDFRQVAAKRFERGRFDFAFFLRRLLRSFARWRVFGGLEVRVEFFQNFLARLFNINVEVFEDAGGHTVTLPQQAQQNVFGADISVVERLGLLGCEGQNFLHSRSVRDVANDFLVRPGADLLFDFHTDGLQIKAHLLED